VPLTRRDGMMVAVSPPPKFGHELAPSAAGTSCDGVLAPTHQLLFHRRQGSRMSRTLSRRRVAAPWMTT